MSERDEDGFLERWSRRKRDGPATGAPQTGAETSAPHTGAETGVDLPPSEGETDAGDPEVIAKLPDLDSLTEETDFTAFLQDGVPEALRRKALRRLWRLNPVFANLDGLNDYDEDYSAGGIIAENIKTIYKVGKGYLDDDKEEDDKDGDDKDGGEAEIAADEVAADGAAPEEVAADETGDAEAAASTTRPSPDNLDRSTGGSKVTLASNPGAPAAGSPAAGGRDTKTEKPARGSALARRWGGSLNQG